MQRVVISAVGAVAVRGSSWQSLCTNLLAGKMRAGGLILSPEYGAVRLNLNSRGYPSYP